MCFRISETLAETCNSMFPLCLRLADTWKFKSTWFRHISVIFKPADFRRCWFPSCFCKRIRTCLLHLPKHNARRFFEQQHFNQQVRWIDRNLFFSILKLLILRRWWQLWKKSTAINQRYRMNLFFVVFCLIVLLPNSMSKLIHSRCKFTCKLFNKIIQLLTSMQTNNCVPVFMF